MTHDPAHRELAVAVDPVTGDGVPRVLRAAATPDDLVRRSKLIELGSLMCGTILSVKDVGSDALLGLLTTLEGEGLERPRVLPRCAADDLVVAVAQTDVKGDRSKSPHEQDDPDMYLRIVDETADGIVVRGAKAHTTFAPNCDELARAPDPGHDRCRRRPWAVGFAVPAEHAGPLASTSRPTRRASTTPGTGRSRHATRCSRP